MTEFDADFVPCTCPTHRDRHGVGVRDARYIDKRSPMHRGTRVAETLCCDLVFALIPPGCAKPRGFTEVESVRLVTGEVVRRLAVIR
jgi:hypothetical protein